MKRAFICSPYRDDDYSKQISNCDNAKEYCKFARLNGVVPIAPHLFHTEFLPGKELILKCTFAFLSTCDEIWIFANFNEDMKKEIEHAKNNSIKIRYFTTNMVERTFNDGLKD